MHLPGEIMLVASNMDLWKPAIYIVVVIGHGPIFRLVFETPELLVMLVGTHPQGRGLCGFY